MRIALLAVVLLFAGCAAPSLLERADTLAREGRAEEALAVLDAELAKRPRDVALRAAHARQRAGLLAQWLLLGDAARAAGDRQRAEGFYVRVLGLEPDNRRAIDGRAALDAERRHAEWIAQGEERLRAEDFDAALAAANRVLAENRDQREARALARRITEQRARRDTRPPVLAAAMQRPVSLEFREAPLRSIFDLMARTTGLNFVFDREVRQDQRATVFVKDAPLAEVLRLVLATNQLAYRVMNENSVLVYPNTPAKQRDYQELVTRVFYLTNLDAKSALAMVKALVKTRDAYVDEKLNMLVLKDTVEAVRYAEQLLAAHDLAEPEVMLEVEVLEVGASRLQEIGIRFPERVSFGAFPTDGTAVPNFVPLTRDTTLRFGLANPLAVLALRGIDATTNLLANPRIRVRNRDKAKVHIGEKVPVFTTTATANVGVSSAVQYLEVGLKLDVEPAVMLDDEVAMKVGLEVSSILETINVNNTVAYRLGTRNTATSLRLRDGETQVLAGLISEEDRRNANRVPGLNELPLMGRLFANNLDTRSKTEIVLLITPRIIRNVARPEALLPEIPSGTDANPGGAPMRMSRTAPGTLAIASVAAQAPSASAQAQSAIAQSPSPAAQPPSPFALTWSAPRQVRSGAEMVVAISASPAAVAGTARFELAFDPQVLEPIGRASGTPGRVPITLARPGGGNATGPVEVRFRVVAAGVPAAELAITNASAMSADGAALPMALPPPLSMTVAQ